MLPKHSRLTKRTIATYLIRAPRLRTDRFLVVWADIPELKRPAVSVSVSKKVAPKASARNNLRRRGYVALRPLIGKIKQNKGILVSYTKMDSKVSIPTLSQELEEAFKKARLI